jgi:hypothetical protein
MKNQTNHVMRAGLVIAALLGLSFAPTMRAANDEGVAIVPPGAKFHGQTSGEWAASFWQWALGLPMEGHPFLDTPQYSFSANQSGSVWYWSSPDGPITRYVTLPAGKSLFLTIRDCETSSLEEPPFYGATEAEQRAISRWFADHIVNVFCVIDGVPVPNIQAYRTETPQFEFTAPTPWIFGNVGGTGTSVGDGYYMMLTGFSKGHHTIHYAGTFHFDAGELGPDAFDLPHECTVQLTVGKAEGENGSSAGPDAQD